MKGESRQARASTLSPRSNLRRATRSIYSYDEVSIVKAPREVERVHPGNVSFFEGMFVPPELSRQIRTSVDDRKIEEYRVRRWGLMSCFGCCYGLMMGNGIGKSISRPSRLRYPCLCLVQHNFIAQHARILPFLFVGNWRPTSFFRQLSATSTSSVSYLNLRHVQSPPHHLPMPLRHLHPNQRCTSHHSMQPPGIGSSNPKSDPHLFWGDDDKADACGCVKAKRLKQGEVALS